MGSFFRMMFRSLSVEDDLPEDLENMLQEVLDDDGADAEQYLEIMSDLMIMFSEQIIPFAIRWYTDEADPDDDDDDFDEDEEDEEEDDDDDDEDDEPPRGGKKGGGKGRQAPKKIKGKSPKDSPATGPAA